MDIDRISSEDKNVIKHIMESHGFPSLKATQKDAFRQGILEEGNHLLVAETGNGKTLCAESLARRDLDKGNRVLYLVPSTQLVSSKKESIEEWKSSGTTISSGRGKYRKGDIVVATFKSFYQAILRGVPGCTEFSLCVLDDFHELYGSFMGADIEKAIAALKQYDIELFAMSATIGNPYEVANWLDADLTVSEQNRSIPIEEKIVRIGSESKKERLGKLVDRESDKGSILVFNFAKSWTESRAEEIADNKTFDGPSIDVESKIENIIGSSIPPSLSNLSDMIENGVAYHHSSLPKRIRSWIEKLFKDGKINCLCATTTIAYGFDSPVRTVVVADMKRFGDWVGKWEYQQWIGRAARPGYGHDKGTAYVLTNQETVVREEYFEPRSLESISSHIEDTESFRKLLLELIVMGWKTPNRIESFLKETLYWSQMSSDGAWGREFEPRDKQLERKLKSTADWLEDRNFIRENRSSSEFMGTELGKASVDFVFSTNISPSLSQVYEFYRWCESTEDTNRLRLLSKVSDVFELGINQKRSSKNIESAIINEGLDVNGNTITAATIHKYWVENEDMRTIEEETQVNSSYLDSQSYTVSTVLNNVDNIMTLCRLQTPNWLDIYSYRVQRGIKRDEVPYVREVDGLGRARIRRTRKFLENHNDNSKLSLDEHLTKLENPKNIINSEVNGVGESIASSLLDYHRSQPN